MKSKLRTDAPSPTTARFHVDHAGWLRQFDPVFMRPIRDGYDAVPVGNGDLAAVHWQPDHLTWMLNKNDISGKAPQAARVKLETPIPVAERIGRLETRLSLGEAVTRVRYDGQAKPTSAWHGDYATPRPPTDADRGTMEADAFVPEGRNALLIRYRAEHTVAQPLTVVLERWRQPAWGDAARAEVRDGCLVLEFEPCEATACSRFAVALAAIGFTGAELRHARDLRLELRVPAALRHEGRIAVAVVTNAEATDPTTAAMALARDTLAADWTALLDRQLRYWIDEFWAGFFVDAGHPYANALYHMALYELGISSRGRVPAKFNGGLNLWGEHERVWNEVYTFHNQHSTHLPLYAAGLGRLADNFHDWIIGMHPEAVKTAEKYFGCAGVFFPEAMSQVYRVPEPDTRWKGNPAEWFYMCYILSTGTRLASLLWDRYEHSLDRDFLRRAYPVIRDVARFYVDYGKLGADGLYHLAPSQAWEERPIGRDSHSDCAAWRAIFRMALDAAAALDLSEPQAEAWRERLAKPPPYPVQDGLFSVVIRDDGTPEPPEHFQWQLPNLSGVYPYGVIGQDTDPALLEVARRTFARYRFNADAGHEYLPVVAARLGDAEAWRAAAFNFMQFFQCFDQGLFNYYSVQGNKDKEYPANRAQLHCYLEGSGIFATSVNEMLLQSHGGVIRVFPATPGHWPARFTLMARGAFRVSSERRPGQATPACVSIEAVGGTARECRVAVPWDGETDLRRNDGTAGERTKNAMVTVRLSPGDQVRLSPVGRNPEDLPVETAAYQRTWSPCRLGAVWYGQKEGANNHTVDFPLW